MLGDPARLEQVFTNLLNNAVRHSPVGAIVADEGDGIAPEQLQSIFELFSRNRDSAMRSNGLGLGLGIARRNRSRARRPDSRRERRPGARLALHR